MPERMSDGKFSGLWQRASQGAGDRHDARDLAHEAARARADVDEKYAQIKALADALLFAEQRHAKGCPPTFCTCGADAALRFAGHLP